MYAIRSYYDQVLRQIGGLLARHIDPAHNFVGHVGGDDRVDGGDLPGKRQPRELAEWKMSAHGRNNFV